jgi:dynein light chain 4
MDKRAGSSWHVVIGEGFGFEITHEMRNLLYMFFGGNIVLWVNSGCFGLESIII